MRFSDGDNFLELDLIERDPDPRLFARVSSNGFLANTETYVPDEALAAFCRALLALNESLNGEATLLSISPGELDLRIHSVTSLGHLAASGKLGWPIQGGHRLYDHALQFGFEFEASELARAIKDPWVRAGAA
jgi:hypothetical protein